MGMHHKCECRAYNTRTIDAALPPVKWSTCGFRRHSGGLPPQQLRLDDWIGPIRVTARFHRRQRCPGGAAAVRARPAAALPMTTCPLQMTRLTSLLAWNHCRQM